jgi:hypothetical protein
VSALCCKRINLPSYERRMAGEIKRVVWALD